MSRFGARAALVALGISILSSCDEGTGPNGEQVLEFGEATLSLGFARSASIVVRNTGSAAAGPVRIEAGPVRKAGVEVPGVAVEPAPDEVAELPPDQSATLQLEVTGAGGLLAGTYQAELRAIVEGATSATAVVTFQVPVPPDEIGSIEIVGLPAVWKQGDVLTLDATVRDTAGAVLDDVAISWSSLPSGRGIFTQHGEFVPYQAGTISIVATAGPVADTATIEIVARGLSGAFSVRGNNAPSFFRTSDLWLFGDVAYTGTWGGNRIYTWNISGDTPVLTDSVVVVASNVNDVKISADGTFAVMTQEGGGTGGAVTILEMSDPEHPTIAGAFTTTESGWHGVHNVWIEGDYVYLSTNGSDPTRGLWIIDVSDLANPVRVAQFHGGSSSLHDVYVRDGLAFLSHWDAGLIILDVGHGIRGGSPTNPVEVSRLQGLGGQTHNAWYWPETGYVFVGEEDYGTPGHMHVVDASDLMNPVEVASFRMPGDAPHNFWLDEDRGILYMAWYSQGLIALDVSGRLLGSLELQGRTIAQSIYSGGGSCPGGDGTCTWAPQLHDGFVFVSDINSGLWKLEPNF